MNKLLIGLVTLAAAALIACGGAAPSEDAAPSGSATPSGSAVQEACVYTIAPKYAVEAIVGSYIAVTDGDGVGAEVHYEPTRLWSFDLEGAFEQAVNKTTSETFPAGYPGDKMREEPEPTVVIVFDGYYEAVYVRIPECKTAEAWAIILERRASDVRQAEAGIPFEDREY